jgi:hypothetical protein
MDLRRFPFMGPGVGPVDIPYDQSGGLDMSSGGMNIPQPGAPMKSMKFDFHDPAQQAAAAMQGQQQGAPVQPNGPLPPGAQPAPDPSQQQVDPSQQQLDPSQQPAPGAVGNVFGGMAGGADQFGQGPDSSMFTDQQLAALVNSQGGGLSPVDLEASQLEQQLGQGDQVPPELQMRMMDAARRRGGF